MEKPQTAHVDGPAWDLSKYSRGDWTPGRSWIVRFLWYYTSLLLFESAILPVSTPKIWILRLFGASVGVGVNIKPNVRIKFPWRLVLGDHTWIGQEVWIDNLATVSIGSHCCISQGVYICTGSHDFKRNDFRLKVGEITIADQSWACCRCTILAGTRVPPRSILSACSLVSPGSI